MTDILQFNILQPKTSRMKGKTLGVASYRHGRVMRMLDKTVAVGQRNRRHHTSNTNGFRVSAAQTREYMLRFR